MRLLSFARLLFVLVVMLATMHRLGVGVWLASQQTWEWGLAAAMLSIMAVLFAIQRVRKPTFWFTIAWFVVGLGATGGCAWLCWHTWTHPASRNWYAIPVIGALAIFAFFVFWSPLLSSFSKPTKLINRLERAIETSDAHAERYLFEARQVVGSGTSLEQKYLDDLERKLRS